MKQQMIEAMRQSAMASNAAARKADLFEVTWDSKEIAMGGKSDKSRKAIVYDLVSVEWMSCKDIVAATQDQYPDFSVEHIRLTCRLLNSLGKIERQQIDDKTSGNGRRVEYRRSRQ